MPFQDGRALKVSVSVPFAQLMLNTYSNWSNFILESDRYEITYRLWR
jgi:hypothetical protein